MKRAFAWIAGLAGIAALGRHLSRRAASAPAPGPAEGTTADPAEGTTADPAEALRSKLAGQRLEAGDDGAEPEPETLNERRARVHAKAQEAIAQMDDADQ